MPRCTGGLDDTSGTEVFLLATDVVSKIFSLKKYSVRGEIREQTAMLQISNDYKLYTLRKTWWHSRGAYIWIATLPYVIAWVSRGGPHISKADFGEERQPMGYTPLRSGCKI